MFKVVENGDGFTNIFCKETGMLICTVRGNSKVGVSCRIPRSQNITSTSDSPVHKVQPTVKDIALNLQPSRLLPTNESVSGSLSSSIDTYVTSEISQPSIPDVKVTEDYFDDCISQEEFMRCLNVVPTQKLENNEIAELNKEFSVRWISRSRPADIAQIFPDIKICDDADLCSPLGSKLMNINFSKNFINDATSMVYIKKYDSYCRFALSSTFLNGGNFPKLRCREMKMYPLTYRPHKSVKLNCHMYSFNKRERLERLQTIKSGLDKKSRQLHSLCNEKQLAVILTRLSENEIKTWTARKIRPMLNTLNYALPRSRSVSPEIEILSVKRSSSAEDKQRQPLARKSKPFIQGGLQDSKLREPHAASIDAEQHVIRSGSRLISASLSGSSLHGKFYRSTSSDHCTKTYMKKLITFISQKKCTVKLCDIVSMVHKVRNVYMIRGTKIKISNFDLIAKRHSSQSYQCHARTKDVSSQPLHFDHAYHRSLPDNSIADKSETQVSSVPRKAAFQNSLNRLLLIKHPQGNNGYFVAPWQQKPLLKKTAPVPVIDLTIEEEASVVSGITNSNKGALISPKCKILEWEFNCFGCGHKCKYPQKAVADIKVMQHMHHFHSVSTPELFLSSYLDTVNHIAIIEAFPGYKRNFND